MLGLLVLAVHVFIKVDIPEVVVVPTDVLGQQIGLRVVVDGEHRHVLEENFLGSSQMGHPLLDVRGRLGLSEYRVVSGIAVTGVVLSGIAVEGTFELMVETQDYETAIKLLEELEPEIPYDD